MDSVTQVALGAAVGYAVLGRKVGYRAALWGGICGTLPDLDVFISMGGPVANFTYHRSFSHSLLILPLLTPFIVWLILKFHPQTATERRGWFWVVLLVLVTHPLLDSLTIYGTQLFWPLLETPVGFGSIFIIDPMYTLPLLVGLIGALALRRQPQLAARINQSGLLISSLYLGWSLLAQAHVTEIARETLVAEKQPTSPLLVTPAPFNTLLWRIVAMNEAGYQEGFYSLLDERRSVHFTQYPSDRELLDGLQDAWPVQRLQWFTKGLYKVEHRDDDIIISDLRMGVEPDYAFNFKVAENGNPHPVAVPDERVDRPQNWARLPALLRRIWLEPMP